MGLPLRRFHLHDLASGEQAANVLASVYGAQGLHYYRPRLARTAAFSTGGSGFAIRSGRGGT